MSDLLKDRRPARPDGTFVERRQSMADTELLTPATQIVGDKDVYLGNTPSDIGRRVSEDQLEMFVVCQPAEALRQQLAQLTPDYITIHDLGTATSARLLAAVAAASQRKVQNLVIRRQGYGVALATLQFVELPLQAGRTLRVYSTQIDSDTQSRQQLALALLAHSRLGVIMVGDLPPHALESSLQPLRQAIAAGPWPNRQLLLVPLGHAASLPTQAASLAGTSAVMVRTTPQVNRPADAWSFISGAWNRLNVAQAAPEASRAPAPAPEPVASFDAHQPPPIAASYAPTQPLELNPMPAPRSVAAVQPQSPNQSAVWSEYVRRCATIKGLTHACIFDLDLQRPLAHSGNLRVAERLAAKGAMLHAVMADTADSLSLGAAAPDAAITLAEHYLLLRPMPTRPRVVLHLVLDRSHGNIGLARAQLHQIDQALLAPAG